MSTLILILQTKVCLPRELLTFTWKDLLGKIIHWVIIKAVFITQHGVGSFNQVDGLLSYSDGLEAKDSRIEVIGKNTAY
jgi:hypothetical protein